MKKVSKLFLIPLMCATFASLSSCSKDNRIKLTYGEVTHQKYHEISYARLEKIISQKESFLLVVDPKGCACFDYFMAASEDYIRDNHFVLYYMKVADFKNNETKGIKIIEGSTSFSIFDQGTIKQSIVSNTSSDIMRDKAKFTEYISKYVRKPNMFLVTPSDLDVIYTNSNKSLIYFGRNTCGDCSYINEHFLYDYMRERDEIMYVLDGDESVRRYDESGELINPEEWQEFKAKYGLTSGTNPKYGYGTNEEGGVVPTFLVVSGTQTTTTYHSGAVAFNDVVTYSPEKNQFLLTQTYYDYARQADLSYLSRTLTPLQNAIVNKDDIFFFDESQSVGTWKHEASAQHYFVRIKAFLETYLPQITYQF